MLRIESRSLKHAAFVAAAVISFPTAAAFANHFCAFNSLTWIPCVESVLFDAAQGQSDDVITPSSEEYLLDEISDNRQFNGCPQN